MNTISTIELNSKWYNKIWLLTIFYIIFFPVGLYAIWKNNFIKKGWKIVLTILSPLIGIIEIGIYAFILMTFVFGAEYYIIEGDKKFQIKNYTGAIEDYSQAIENDTSYASAYFARGNAKLLLYRLKMSNENAVDNNWTALDKNNTTNPINDYNKAIQLNPNFRDAYLKRGWLQKDLKEYDEAIANFSTMLEIDKNDTTALIERVSCNIQKRAYDAGIPDLKNLIKINQNCAIAYRFMGVCKANLDYADTSICSYFDKAIQLGDSKAIEAKKYYCTESNGRTDLSWWDGDIGF